MTYNIIILYKYSISFIICYIRFNILHIIYIIYILYCRLATDQPADRPGAPPPSPPHSPPIPPDKWGFPSGGLVSRPEGYFPISRGTSCASEEGYFPVQRVTFPSGEVFLLFKVSHFLCGIIFFHIGKLPLASMLL